MAPAGCENMVFLIPVAAGLEGRYGRIKGKIFSNDRGTDGETYRRIYSGSVVYKKSYSVSDFVNDYNSFRGNAYGLANTLRQTAIFRPSCQE